MKNDKSLKTLSLMKALDQESKNKLASTLAAWAHQDPRTALVDTQDLAQQVRVAKEKQLGE